ncbi:MAG: bifunctional nuclease family protein [Elusimicrobia bacterium]|nr:bifunctional nuclease family protein [Elusimicrobiota bacterium]MDE2425851.1 bifunctional nuclease family protein [Elusimicrobiota bacterium]
MPKNEEGGGRPHEKEVRIYSLATTVNECIIFLEELSGNRLLPIWIGITEGQAIAIRFSGIVLPRPLTHDLLLAAIKTLGYAVERVVISDIKENTFYARIYIHKGDTVHALDSRPSDAIAVAVRAGCSIFVEDKVFSRCQTLNKPITEDEVSKFKSDLKNLRPEDIFKGLKKEGSKGGEEEGGGPTKPGGDAPQKG